MNIELLTDEDANVRARALGELAGLGAPEQEAAAGTLAALAQELADELVSLDEEGDDTDEVEERLAAVLKALTHLATGTPALRALAAHEASVVRKEVVSAVADERSAPRQELLTALATDEDDDVRHAAARAITGDPWPEAVTPLRAALEIGKVPRQEVSEALAAAAAVADAAVQAEVAGTLLAIGRSAAEQQRPFDAMQRRGAFDALVRHGATFPGVQEAAPALAASDDLRVRITGIALRAGSGDAASFEQLLLLAAKGSTDESASANVLLRALPAKVVAPALATLMGHRDPLVRARAAELSVGTIFLAREASIDPLLTLARDADERVRVAAVASLGRALPPGKAFFGEHGDRIAPVLDALASDPSRKVKAALEKARKVLGHP